MGVLKRQTSLSIILSSEPLQNDYHHYCFIYSQGIHNFNFAKFKQPYPHWVLCGVEMDGENIRNVYYYL